MLEQNLRTGGAALRKKQGKSFWQPDLHTGSIFAEACDDNVCNPTYRFMLMAC
jgi:hypothetical protein